LAGLGRGTAGDGDDPRPFVLQMLGWSSRDAAACALAVLATVAILTNVLFLQSGPHPAPMLKSGLVPPAAAAQQAAVGAVPASGSGQNAATAKPAPAKAEQPQTPAAPRGSAEIISDIQRELARRGFFEDPADGRKGPKTVAAIRNFERAAKLKPSTEPNEALLRSIMNSNVKTAKAAKAAPGGLRPPAAIPAPVAATRPAAPAVAQQVPAPQPAVARNEAADPAAKRVLAVQRALADYGYGQLKPTGVIDGPTHAAIQKFERERNLPVTGQVSERMARELTAITGRAVE
jgi:peptidoglycan hydrolase-like protein with peptidoglycan-binding domain